MTPSVSNASETIRIAIAGEDAGYCQKVEAAVMRSSRLRCDGSRTSLREFTDLVGATKPLVALVDLRLDASKEGCNLIKVLGWTFPTLKIVVLSSRPEEAAICYLLGAKAFFHLFNLDGLPEAICSVSAGGTVILPEMAEHLLQYSRNVKHENSLRQEALQFSRRELEILSLVHKGVDRKSISRCLFISEFTVKRHLENALGKTSFQSVKEIVERFTDFLPEIHQGMK